MKNIIKLTLMSLLTCSTLYSQITIEKLGVHIGHGTISYDKKDIDGIITMNKPDTSYFPALEIFGVINGGFDDATLKPFASYTYLGNDDFKQQYILAGLNKYYFYNNCTYYTGVYGGISSLKWKYDPLNSSKDTKPTSTAIAFGVQGGLEYPMADRLSFDLNIKAMWHGHHTDLEPSDGVKGEIDYLYSTFLGAGIVYSF